MDDREAVRILIKVYSCLNKIKVALTLGDYVSIWRVVNELTDYIMSIELSVEDYLLSEGSSDE